jgi:phospholipid/cholesterol/gamma-HCH transport system substrate-binding protein
VFLITHDLDTLHAICDRVAVLADKRVIAIGTIPELIAIDHPWINEYFSGPPRPRRGCLAGAGARKDDELMETRSNHVLVGAVVLILLALLGLFTVWIARLGTGDQREYDIFFKQAVEGLARGSQSPSPACLRARSPRSPCGRPTPSSSASASACPTRSRSCKARPPASRRSASPASASLARRRQAWRRADQLPGAAAGDRVPLWRARHPDADRRPRRDPQLRAAAARAAVHADRAADRPPHGPQPGVGGRHPANTQRLTDSFADRGPEIAATLAQTRVAIQQAGDAAQQIGELAETTNGVLADDVRPTISNLNRTIASAQRSADTLNTVIGDAQPGVQAFQKQTLPEVNQLVRDLRRTSDALASVAEKVDSQGAGALIGQGKLPDYKGK